MATSKKTSKRKTTAKRSATSKQTRQKKMQVDKTKKQKSIKKYPLPSGERIFTRHDSTMIGGIEGERVSALYPYSKKGNRHSSRKG